VASSDPSLRPSSRFIEPADQATVRRNNLSLVLRHLRDQGPRSRADIAAETQLNKATVSSLVAELEQRGLVRETGIKQAGSVGRPARILRLDGGRVGALGLAVNVDYVAVYGTDLSGRVLVERRHAVDALGVPPAQTIATVAGHTRAALADLDRAGVTPAGIGVAVPGLVDVGHGGVVLAPNLGWRDVPLAERLSTAIVAPHVPVHVDNDANLSALAEFWVGGQAGTPNLAYLTGEVGIGGGVIVEGRLLRGAAGFAGEIGHLPVDPDGTSCGCGRTGCWETKVGLAALVGVAAPGGAPGDIRGTDGRRLRDLKDRLAEVVRLANSGDPGVRDALAGVGRWLGYGAGLLVNLLNPQVIVAGGHFTLLAEHLLPAAQREMDRLAVAGAATGCRIVPSELGFTAAVRGAAGLVVESVLDDPTAVSQVPLLRGYP
jgi:predicted NBD/HSP70 family sugar kinase